MQRQIAGWVLGVVAMTTACVQATDEPLAPDPPASLSHAVAPGRDPTRAPGIIVFQPSLPWAGVGAGFIHADGRRRSLPVEFGMDDYEFTWSPNGRQLAFMRARPTTHPPYTTHEIHVADVTGSGSMQLTATQDLRESDPTWSPNGRRIAYSAGSAFDHSGLDTDIYVMDADGSDVRNLTQSPGIFEGPPTWGPGGRRIAFASRRDGVSGIYVMEADGSNVERIGDGERWFGPAWAPNGRSLAVLGPLGDRESTIYLMDAKSGRARRLLDFPARDPAWSPNSRHIVFSAYRENGTASPLEGLSLYVMNADGSNVTELDVSGFRPDWSFGGPLNR